MKKISICVQKGGTGKTTTTGNISAALARGGKRVLMCDLDSQGNLTSWLHTWDLKHHSVDVLRGDIKPSEAIVSLSEGLDLLPTKGGGILKRFGERELNDYRKCIEKLAGGVAGKYDYIFFDLGPGLGDWEKLVLSSMDEVVPVIAAEFFSIDGLSSFENELDLLKENHGAAFKMNKIIINRFNKSFSFHKKYVETLRNFRGDLAFFIIGQSTDISDCLPAHKSLIDAYPGNKFVAEYQRIGGAL